MAFWKNLVSAFAGTAKNVLVVGTVNELVLQAKAEVDKQSKLTPAEKDAAKVGVDLLAERVRKALS
jgi:hypothetical protein